MSPRLLSCIVALILSSTLHATTVIQPVAISLEPGSLIDDPGFPISNLVSPYGITPQYTSGVTDFDSYITGDPTSNGIHIATPSRATPSPPVAGYIEFDFGALHTIDAIALWNIGGNESMNVKTFDLIGDADGDFSSGAVTLLAGQTANANNGIVSAVAPETFTFSQTNLRYLRFDITMNNGNANFVGVAHIAARGVAVPEPSALALLTTLAVAFATQRRFRTPA